MKFIEYMTSSTVTLPHQVKWSDLTFWNLGKFAFYTKILCWPWHHLYMSRALGSSLFHLWVSLTGSFWNANGPVLLSVSLLSPMKWLTYWTSSPNLYFRFFVLTHLDVWDFSAFFFAEISPVFSLYHLTSFLETPKAHGMTQGSLVSLLAPFCPGTSLWHRWKPPLPGSQNPFYL